MPRGLLALSVSVVLLACSENGSDKQEVEDCADNEVLTDYGECIDWAYRHEPQEQLDLDNVSNPSGAVLTKLTDIKGPPRSGFRIILEPIEVMPGEDLEYCHSWPIPDLENDYVYTAEVHSTVGLHHANLFAIEENESLGKQPYPDCHPGASSFIGGGISATFTGTPLRDVAVPEILFANSTQILEGERMSFAEGRAYPVTRTEVVADTHVFNPTPDPIRVEVVYDFYTMPKEQLTEELRAFMYMWTDFEIAAQSREDIVAECEWYGGNVAAIMPHMHEWGVNYNVEFLDADDNVLSNPYNEAGFNLPETDIRVFEDPIDTSAATKVRFTCGYDNTTDHPMCHGIGENEMCFFFGYVGPPEHQGFGIVPTEGAPCVGDRRDGTKMFDLLEYLDELDPEVRERLLYVYTMLPEGSISTCPDLSPD